MNKHKKLNEKLKGEINSLTISNDQNLIDLENLKSNMNKSPVIKEVFIEKPIIREVNIYQLLFTFKFYLGLFG